MAETVFEQVKQRVTSVGGPGRSRVLGRVSRWRLARMLLAAALVSAGAAVAVPLALPGVAAATACTTAGVSSASPDACTIGTSVTIDAGTFTVVSSPTLYWQFVLSGYDQWASASSTTLGSCSVSSGATACSGGTQPVLLAVDATGAGKGWNISEYISSSDLPSGSALYFNGAGSTTYGDSTVAPVSTTDGGFTATTPSTVCDYASTCTNATPTSGSVCGNYPGGTAGSTSCPADPVNMLASTSSTAQEDLYSAESTTGVGAICFATGTATARGCASTTNTAFYNLGIPSSALAGTYASTVVNIQINAGP